MELDGHATPWPMEWYQAVLLSIIAGLCIGGTRIVTKARLLCGLFVAHLRCVGMFDLEAEMSGEDDDEEGSEDDASEGSEDEDVEDDDGDESEVHVKQPKPQTLNRKR